MTTTGLRTIEVSRADIEDFRPLGDGMVLYVQGKGHDDKTEYVKITSGTEEAVRSYLAARGPVSGADPLFASTSNNSRGRRLSTVTISGTTKRAMRSIGLDSDRLTAHSLRHTCATVNLLAGGTLEETQELLRHSSITTTMIYSHALERAANQSEQRVEDYVSAVR